MGQNAQAACPSLRRMRPSYGCFLGGEGGGSYCAVWSIIDTIQTMTEDFFFIFFLTMTEVSVKSVNTLFIVADLYLLYQG